MSDKLNYDETITTLKAESGLIEKYWEDYVQYKDLSFVVKPSIPIIWFGNLEAYCNSSVRVVTIGLNPSSLEFPKDKQKCRFPAAQELYNKLCGLDKSDIKGQLNLIKGNEQYLIDSYNEYFNIERYGWFEKHFENNVFDCFPETLKVSYYKYENDSQRGNTAIHIDCQTALATDPAWGGLINALEDIEKIPNKQKEKLKDIKDLSVFVQKGIKNKEGLFWSLLKVIDPDIMIISQREDEYVIPLIKGLDPLINDIANNVIDSATLATFVTKGKKQKKEWNIKRFGYKVNKKLVFFGFNLNKTPFYGTSQKRYEEMINENGNNKKKKINEIGIDQWKVFKQMVKQYMELEPEINRDIDYELKISQGQKLFEETINQCKDLEKEINECKIIFECWIKQRKMFEQMINKYLEWKE